MPDGQEDFPCQESIHMARSLQPSRSEETWHNSVHAQRWMNQNKSCRVGIFCPEVVFQVARYISRASGCLGLPRPIHGITLRLAPGEEQSWVDLRTGLWSRRNASKRSEEALENFSRGFYANPSLCVNMCAHMCALECQMRSTNIQICIYYK